MEFLVAVSLVLLIFTITTLILYHRYTRAIDLKVYMDGSRVVNSVAYNLNEIVAVGDGYSQSFTLPGNVYGSPYNLSFFANEPNVFLSALDFHWSVPIATNSIGCSLKSCTFDRATGELRISVGDTIPAKLTNNNGVVCIGNIYNLQQGQNGYSIIPYHGGKNSSYDTGTSCMTDPLNLSLATESVMYFYIHGDETVSLIMKHGVSPVKLDLHDLGGDFYVELSDDAGEFDLSQNPEGNWSFTSESYCDGADLRFTSKCFKLCLSPLEMTDKWYWLNADGSRIKLNNTQEVCLGYP